MKNSQIHSGLENKELRDYLSIAIVKTYEAEFNMGQLKIPYAFGIDYSINALEAEIEQKQEKLSILKDRRAIMSIIRMNNWQEFDVSDETQKDLSHGMSMNFIGTEQEYESFLKQLSK